MEETQISHHREQSKIHASLELVVVAEEMEEENSRMGLHLPSEDPNKSTLTLSCKPLKQLEPKAGRQRLGISRLFT